MCKNVKFHFIIPKLLLFLLGNVLFAHFVQKPIYSVSCCANIFFYVSFSRRIKLETQLGKHHERGESSPSYSFKRTLILYTEKKINRITVDISQPRIEPPRRRVYVLTSKAHVSRPIDRCFFSSQRRELLIKMYRQRGRRAFVIAPSPFSDETFPTRRKPFERTTMAGKFIAVVILSLDFC